MTIEFDSRPFWKPRDLAAMLDVSPSQIYRLIDAGELEHVKVGQRTVRVPAASVARYLGHSAPGTEPIREEADVESRVRRFKERTGLSPDDFIAAWRREEITDTSEHNQDAMEALALLEAGVGSSSMSIA